MVNAYIALGGNLGERRQMLDAALASLRAEPGIRITKVSSYYETAPVGGPAGQGNYLNAAAALETTDLTPRGLLRILLETEAKFGRVRGAERFGPRTLDLDLLLFGDVATLEDDLEVPHPRMHERLFVLEPLAEIAGAVIHPARRTTIAGLLMELKQRQRGRDLAGRRALVTGSTSGIGRAIALELALAGADVLIHGRRSRERAEEVASTCRTFDVRTEVLLADVREETACAELVDAAWKPWDGVDIWVNNAGADTLTGEAERWPFERKLAELWAVDVRATMVLSRHVGERMRARGGVIVNMGWDQAETGMEGDSGQLFGATKGAVMAFTRSLALSLAPQVRVNCVAPGWIRTAWGEHASPIWQERVRRETPLERWGTPADVAKAVHWLASPTAEFVTGQIIRVNGGAVRG